MKETHEMPVERREASHRHDTAATETHSHITAGSSSSTFSGNLSACTTKKISGRRRPHARRPLEHNAMWNTLLQMLNDPHARHAAAVHIPIALGVLGVPLTILMLLTRSGSLALKWLTLGAFLLCSLGAGVAANAGEEAEDRLGDLTQAEEGYVSRHEELGENGWAWPLIPAALVGISLLARKHRPVALTADALVLAASVGVACWVGITAHAGGELVYLHGIGVPARAAAVESDTAPQPPARSQDAGAKSHDDDD